MTKGAGWYSLRRKYQPPHVAVAGPNINLQVSRTSGVAPLAVFFDASGTTDSSTSLPFHELSYSWNFGDSGGGTFPTDGASKNTATGPVTAHVFETGSVTPYTVTLTVTNGTLQSQTTVQITANVPDTVYAGTATIAIGASTLPVAGVDGVPAGADCMTVSDWPTIINTHVADNTRILLKHDDTFTGTATALLDNSGVTIGMYGSGAKPIIRTTGTANNSDILEFTGTCDDCRIVDLDLDGQSDVHRNCIRGTGTFDLSRLLLFRVDMHNAGSGFTTSVAAGSIIPDGIFLVDCTIRTINQTTGSDSVGYALFMDGTKLAVLGTESDTTTGTAQHLLRVNVANRGVFSHNLLQNSVTGKEMFALRGPPPTGSGPYPAGYATQFCVLSHNQVETNTYCGIQVDSDANVADASVVQDVILESNFFVRTTGGTGDMRLRGVRYTARNNISILSGAASGILPIAVYGTGTHGTVTENIWLYNNSMYSSTNPGAARMVDLNDTGIIGLLIRNNVLYVPSYTGTPETVHDFGSDNLYVENNNTVTKTSTPTMFTTIPPVVPVDFTPGAASPLIDAGFAVPIWYDYLGATRTADAAMDQGAIES